MTGPISPETLYSRLLDTEVRLASQKAQRDQREQYQLMANVAAHGNNGGGKQYTRGGHQGNHGGHSRGGGCTGNPNNPYKNHQCDICGKLGHSALRCWKRFDKNFNRPTKSVHTRQLHRMILTLSGMLIVLQQIISWVILISSL
jgi:hypothetical protein